MAKQNPTSQGAERRTGPEPQRRIIVQYPTLRKVSIDAYLNIGQAMDRLGAARFPAEWGVGEVWKAHPFRQDPRTKDFVRYQLTRKDGRFCIRTLDLEACFQRQH